MQATQQVKFLFAFCNFDLQYHMTTANNKVEKGGSTARMNEQQEASTAASSDEERVVAIPQHTTSRLLPNHHSMDKCDIYYDYSKFLYQNFCLVKTKVWLMFWRWSIHKILLVSATTSAAGLAILLAY
jgi:hypothetical protein